MIAGTIDVAAAGTAAQSSKSGTIRAISFKARIGNTGNIYLGNSDVSSTNGMELEPGEAWTWTYAKYGKIQDWYADAATNGDDVDFVADNSGDA